MPGMKRPSKVFSHFLHFQILGRMWWRTVCVLQEAPLFAVEPVRVPFFCRATLCGEVVALMVVFRENVLILLRCAPYYADASR